MIVNGGFFLFRWFGSWRVVDVVYIFNFVFIVVFVFVVLLFGVNIKSNFFVENLYVGEFCKVLKGVLSFFRKFIGFSENRI